MISSMYFVYLSLFFGLILSLFILYLAASIVEALKKYALYRKKNEANADFESYLNEQRKNAF